jgi:hypothetical protein
MLKHKKKYWLSYLADLRFLLLTLLLCSFTGKDYTPPPGTKSLGGNLYLDKKAITNRNWKEFLHSNMSDSIKIRISKLPDTTVTYKGKNYFNSPEFADFPVVGVSMKQIDAYCRWRSYVVNYYIYDERFRANKGSKEYAEVFNRNMMVIYAAAEKDLLEKEPEKTLGLPQLSADGTILSGSKKASDFNKPVFAFRCMATYLPKH